MCFITKKDGILYSQNDAVHNTFVVGREVGIEVQASLLVAVEVIQFIFTKRFVVMALCLIRGLFRQWTVCVYYAHTSQRC